MPMTAQPEEAVIASVAKLTITPASAAKPKKTGASKKPTKQKVADSWEDEDLSSEPDSGSGAEEGGADCGRASTAAGSLTGTEAPPPTPVSPNYRSSAGGTQAPPPTPVTPSQQSAVFSGSQPSSISAALAASGAEDQRRPEKTDAVARRMIASALGVKVPRQTEDQKAYDRALRERERKRRDEEREAEKKRLEEVERAKRAIWED